MRVEAAKRDLIPVYEKLKEDINKRINDFIKTGMSGDPERLFVELAFCLLTPSSKAKNAWQAIETMLRDGVLFRGSKEDISEYLNIVRFKNQKAYNIVLAREKILFNNKVSIVGLVNKNRGNPYPFREWLVKNIRGFGYKEATHFLRNIGISKDMCILDRHILRNLAYYEVAELPKYTMSRKNYLLTESKMQDFARNIGIDILYLDFIFWYRETGEIFK